MPVILGLSGKVTKESAVEAVMKVGAWGLDVEADADVVEL
jgi:hypothetical protein